MKRSMLGIFFLILSWFIFVPVVLAVDKNHLEGWIIKIDYQKSNFHLLDARGFKRRVVTKPGTIGDYAIGDKVRVEIDPGYKRANSIEKLT